MKTRREEEKKHNSCSSLVGLMGMGARGVEEEEVVM